MGVKQYCKMYICRLMKTKRFNKLVLKQKRFAINCEPFDIYFSAEINYFKRIKSFYGVLKLLLRDKR